MKTLSDRSSAGLTLVEVVVLVVVLSLAAALAMPALGQARRAAMNAQCQNNLGAQAKGFGNYAAANRSELPNAPVSPGGAGIDAIYGPKWQTQYYFASRALPLAAFDFPNPGIITMQNPANNNALNSVTWNSMEGPGGYFMWLVPYMDEITQPKSKVAALSDVFLAPSDASGLANWAAIRKGLLNGSAYPPIRRNEWPSPYAGQFGAFARLGSYRFASCAMLDYRLFLQDSPTTVFNVRIRPSNFSSVVRRNTLANIRVPSGKVLLWQWFTSCTPDVSHWFEPNALTPVMLGDGSVRTIVPFLDGLPGKPEGPDFTGPILSASFIAQGGTVHYPLHFFATWGGLQGRDLASPGPAPVFDPAAAWATPEQD
ncbi:MAG: hypothetical protein IBJ11_07020 [Phycisphaerales bacterium]|nr:hypothetical protein [Phycisphaerales bacterium]